jgi:DNA-binding XRE family transcriptional regulator
MSSTDDLLGLNQDDPIMRRAEVLVENDSELLRSLIRIRKDSGLKQIHVARLLGISQASVAAFERYDNDPKLSTIRRYAHAVGALVAHQVEADTGQLFDSRSSRWMPVHLTPSALNVTEMNFGHSRSGQFMVAAESLRTDFALGA